MSRFVVSLLAAVSCLLFLANMSGCGGAAGSATKAPASYQLTVNGASAAAGTVTSTPQGINCPGTCSATFSPNTQVQLTATPASSYSFAGWSGSCSGTGACQVTMNTSVAVSASFSGGSSGGGPAGAWVYLSTTSGKTTEISGFSADSEGTLTPVPGSPFADNVGELAGSGTFLFGTDGVNIFSFAVASNGSISKVGSVNARQHNNPANCSGGPAALFVDRTGATLYDLDYDSDCANNSYQSFRVSSSGALKYLGMTSDVSPVFEAALQFAGNDQYAYGASCYHFYQEIFGFQRNADGTLTLMTNLGESPQMPEAPAGDAYCPDRAAADNSNHVAVALTPTDGSTFQPAGAPQLALYTADASGNLSTASTVANMPQVQTGAVSDMETSPSGQFLAVAGTGLQIFQFNGASAMTSVTGVLTSDSIDQLAWDNNGHLYAISNKAGKLYVFAVSSSGAVQTSGSPYAVAQPSSIAVVPQS